MASECSLTAYLFAMVVAVMNTQSCSLLGLNIHCILFITRHDKGSGRAKSYVEPSPCHHSHCLYLTG